MIKSIFFSDSMETFAEYALNLEDKGIDYWVALNVPELHSLIKQVNPAIVFIDYKMIDHELFDVRKHVGDYNKDLIVLFFNNPNQDKKLQLIYWQDDVTQLYQRLYNMEIENFISDAAGYVEPKYYGPAPTKLRGTIYDPDVNKVENDNLEIKQDKASVPNREVKTNSSSTTDYIDLNIIRRLIKVRTKYKINFSEMLLLELLYKNKNKMVSIHEIMDTVWPEDKYKSITSVYSCIYNIRNFLAKEEKGAEIIRVKKGFYSLVLPELSDKEVI